MAYVYKHIREDKKEIFYIGIGKIKNYKRAYEKNKSRNPLWENIVKKTDYTVEIIVDNLSWEEACNKEKELIKLYGRIDLGTGTLANLTDGGDGNSNFSESTKQKISHTLKGKIQSLETRQKRSKTLKEIWKNEDLRKLKREQSKKLNELGIIGTKGKPSKKKGVPLTLEQKEKLSSSLKKHYENNNVWNKKNIDENIQKQIIEDYLNNNVNVFKLSKKYNLNRKVITRILQENSIFNTYENNKNITSGS